MRRTLIIVVGPSGVGKSSLLERARAELPYLEDTTTYTTRAMRDGESEGHPYHFVSKDQFEKLIKEDFFVEWATVHQHFYGTPHEQIRQAWSRDHVIIMDVDIQGAQTFKRKYPDSLAIFVHPPSFNDLRQRLIKRSGGEPKDLDIRLQTAQKEIALASTCDRQIMNDDFERAYAEFKKLIEDFVRKS